LGIEGGAERLQERERETGVQDSSRRRMEISRGLAGNIFFPGIKDSWHGTRSYGFAPGWLIRVEFTASGRWKVGLLALLACHVLFPNVSNLPRGLLATGAADLWGHVRGTSSDLQRPASQHRLCSPKIMGHDMTPKLCLQD